MSCAEARFLSNALRAARITRSRQDRRRAAAAIRRFVAITYDGRVVEVVNCWRQPAIQDILRTARAFDFGDDDILEIPDAVRQANPDQSVPWEDHVSVRIENAQQNADQRSTRPEQRMVSESQIDEDRRMSSRLEGTAGAGSGYPVQVARRPTVALHMEANVVTVPVPLSFVVDFRRVKTSWRIEVNAIFDIRGQDDDFVVDITQQQTAILERVGVQIGNRTEVIQLKRRIARNAQEALFNAISSVVRRGLMGENLQENSLERAITHAFTQLSGAVVQINEITRITIEPQIMRTRTATNLRLGMVELTLAQFPVLSLDFEGKRVSTGAEAKAVVEVSIGIVDLIKSLGIDTPTKAIRRITGIARFRRVFGSAVRISAPVLVGIAILIATVAFSTWATRLAQHRGRLWGMGDHFARGFVRHLRGELTERHVRSLTGNNRMALEYGAATAEAWLGTGSAEQRRGRGMWLYRRMLRRFNLPNRDTSINDLIDRIRDNIIRDRIWRGHDPAIVLWQFLYSLRFSRSI